MGGDCGQNAPTKTNRRADCGTGINLWIKKMWWEKKMATHSSIHAWKTPWTKETGGLQSMVSQRVGHD